MTKHDLIEFVAGDDWEIVATLLDELGFPYNLTGSPVIKWRLITSSGIAVIGDEAVITVTDPTHGVCSVRVPASVTSPVNGGVYTDALRLVMGGESGTLLMGPVSVIANPWAFPEQAPSLLEYHRPRLLPRPVRRELVA